MAAGPYSPHSGHNRCTSSSGVNLLHTAQNRIPGGKVAGKLSAEASPTADTHNIQLLTVNASIK